MSSTPNLRIRLYSLLEIVDPRTMYEWTSACRKYQKHGGRTDADVVSFVADGMLEVRLSEWYRANTTRIDALTLDAFFGEVRDIVLESTWAHELREEILRFEQGNQKFMDFSMENLTSLLKAMSPLHFLTDDALKLHAMWLATLTPLAHQSRERERPGHDRDDGLVMSRSGSNGVW